MKKGKAGSKSVRPVSCVSRFHGATAKVADAHHVSNGNVFDECLFSCQVATLFTAMKQKTGEENSIPYLFPHLRAKSVVWF